MFRTADRSAFRAHQAGLKNHKENCEVSLCDICRLAGAVSKFTWDMKNYSRYLKPLDSWPKILEKNKVRKKVSFDGPEILNEKKKSFEVNMLSFSLACLFNVSLIETRLLK